MNGCRVWGCDAAAATRRRVGDYRENHRGSSGRMTRADGGIFTRNISLYSLKHPCWLFAVCMNSTMSPALLFLDFFSCMSYTVMFLLFAVVCFDSLIPPDLYHSYFNQPLDVRPSLCVRRIAVSLPLSFFHIIAVCKLVSGEAYSRQ